MTRRHSPGRGSAHRSPAVRRFSIPFDDETAGEIQRRAARAGTSAAEQVRQLVEWGLEADEPERTRGAARPGNR